MLWWCFYLRLFTTFLWHLVGANLYSFFFLISSAISQQRLSVWCISLLSSPYLMFLCAGLYCWSTWLSILSLKCYIKFAGWSDTNTIRSNLENWWAREYIFLSRVLFVYGRHFTYYHFYLVRVFESFIMTERTLEKAATENESDADFWLIPNGGGNK